MNKLAFYAISAAMVLFASCSGKKAEEKDTVEEVKPKVKLQIATLKNVEQIQEYAATVEAEVKNNIFPATPSRIEKINVEVGDRVVKGQRLVDMDSSNLKQAKLQLDNQLVEFKRIDELYRVGGLSKSDWENAKTMLDVKQTAYKYLLDNTSLVSPINGIVTARNYDNGDMCSATSPVLVVEQISPVKLKINASESLYSYMKKGKKVSVKFDVYGDEDFNGVIDLVYPTINPNTRTFMVEVKMDNRDMRVKPGMYAKVLIKLSDAERVMVSDRAVVKQPGSGDRYVYVYKDGVVSYNKVELGRRINDEYEIKGGIEPNSQVVVAGQAKLSNGAEVTVEE